ncbi:lipase member I-like isoform X2 [Eupeodes corollae]|uniref:lipase member I-like isoform X2 n=1 Tax=Eupeodes corollae TaxID=290404 RepID=UPI0024918C4C|nr:lipase member I-like isoform X2 [Eupeodes corollae]
MRTASGATSRYLIGLVVIVFFCGKFGNSQRVILQSLYLGDSANFNTSREDCVWKRGNDLYDKCPDPDINLYLYTKLNGTRQQLDIEQGDWLRNNEWDPQKENIILIHGYAGGDNTLPMSVLRDAYLRHGNYNLFVADWGALALPPCYVAAVHNLKTVARCLAESFTFLRNSGMKVDRTTCVGHSLGAHICGLMANYLNFRVERIIGLDPARPLIKPGNSNRLDSGDAKAVHVIHTNAGFYGETGKVGHVDFCVNGGKRQPYCGGTSNANLCSHIWSICYLAQSIYTNQEPHAEPCSRRCPSGLRRISRSQAQYNVRNAIPMGMHTPMSAFGSYCLKDNATPFCPRTENDIGDPRCCLADAAEEVTDNSLRLFRRLV